MRRFVMVVFATCLLVGLMLPAIAAANPWVVKNSAGNRMGKVKRTAARKCVVFDRAGRRCGGVEWNSTAKTYIAWKAYRSDTGLRKYGHIDGPHMSDSYDWYIDNEGYPGIDGLAFKSKGRWIALTWSSNRVRGKVSAKCPGWGAAGAIFVLSKAFH